MQAPTHSGTRIGFIGAGRVGLALSRALARASERVVAASSRSRTSAEALAAHVPGCVAVARAQEVIAAADLVFLSVPDDAIAEVAGSLVWRAGVAAVHCSGASELAVLDAARTQGAGVGSFHPLQLFADPEVAAGGLARCAIALEAEPPLYEDLERLVQALGARALRVPPGGRAAYHAASHYGGAFLCVLIAQAVEILGAIGIRGEAAIQALVPLARGTLDAIEQCGPVRAVSGAYARGDFGTATRHIEALGGVGGDIGAFYRVLAEKSVALALEAGRIDEEQAARFRALLDSHRSEVKS
jgi:predicted short-subunit dehydrogenase-like oxidoreductase (DUF2520 family)